MKPSKLPIVTYLRNGGKSIGTGISIKNTGCNCSIQCINGSCCVGSEVVGGRVEITRYNSLGFKDLRGKYVLYDDHENRLMNTYKMVGDMYNSMILMVNDMFK